MSRRVYTAATKRGFVSTNFPQRKFPTNKMKFINGQNTATYFIFMAASYKNVTTNS
jgi:hypothetical protein